MIKEEQQKAIGNNIAEYNEKRSFLNEKWSKKRPHSHSQATICPILNSDTDIAVSIVADNLSFFAEHIPSGANEYNLIDVACVCGSRQIGDFLLKKQGLDYTSKGCERWLKYVMESPNHHWAIDIAREMAKDRVSMPTSSYSITHSLPVTMAVRDVFNSSGKNISPKNNPRP